MVSPCPWPGGALLFYHIGRPNRAQSYLPTAAAGRPARRFHRYTGLCYNVWVLKGNKDVGGYPG
jgi:hypothetical protein